jgi:aminoglycoside phosphotransferase (APT) family kinase protein
MTEDEAILARAQALPCFSAPAGARPLDGGKTNHNILVTDGGRRFVVRFGNDIPEHGILRWNELALSRAAQASGVGPAVVYAAPGVLVLDHINARPLQPDDIARPGTVAALARLIARVHRDTMRQVAGPVLAFDVFHILRGYARFLMAQRSPHVPLLPALLSEAEALEAAVGDGPTVLGHNDLLPGNILTTASGSG